MMTLYDLLENYDEMSDRLKKRAWEKLSEFINKEGDSELLKEIFELASNYESDDYFGTEGLKF